MSMEEWLKGLAPIIMGMILGTLLAHVFVVFFFG